MKIVKNIEELRHELALVKNKGLTVGLVPTMGALHEGHLSLVAASAAQSDYTVVSIFLNPLQFGENEDLDTYPRRLETDAELCAQHGAQLIFAPEASTMYHPEHATFVHNSELEEKYCGKYRPGHFRGVLTVVAKLFLAVEPSKAFFGKKDYQQAALIKNMVRDLNWNIVIELLETSREDSGLARSSRNEYMSAEQRNDAAAIYRGLEAAQKQYENGEREVSTLLELVQKSIKKSSGKLQYLHLVDAQTLLPLKNKVEKPAVILVAAFYGETRLIDNLELGV
ncbi:MAG: pantoate--beta-alanine ligase [Fibrobacter sp.]|nr:pantoate--beta-alanine ligase [Fibrobacter sp.]